MADLHHYWGDDLMFSDTGDLLMASGSLEGLQRVLRRLLTNTPMYIWHVDYGAGVPQKIGELTNIPSIISLIRSQIHKESVVAQNPSPSILLLPRPDGLFCEIRYVDAVTQTPEVLSFNIDR